MEVALPEAGAAYPHTPLLRFPAHPPTHPPNHPPGDFYPLWKHEQTGHNLTEADMVDYLRYLGQEVHARNMGWGLLNSQMVSPVCGCGVRGKGCA
jgi:hypothetical protein